MPVLAHPSLRRARRGLACLSPGRLQGRYINDCEDLPFCGRIDGWPAPDPAISFQDAPLGPTRQTTSPSNLDPQFPLCLAPSCPFRSCTSPGGAGGPNPEIGGGGGIRTPGELAPTSDFKSGALNQLSHSSGLRIQAEVWPTEVNRLGAPLPTPPRSRAPAGPVSRRTGGNTLSTAVQTSAARPKPPGRRRPWKAPRRGRQGRSKISRGTCGPRN